MMLVDVTPKVWGHLLAIRQGSACTCCGDWTTGERAALDLYGPLARRDLGPSVAAQIGQSLDGRVATHRATHVTFPAPTVSPTCTACALWPTR